MTILPTHTCFDDALDWIVGRLQQDGASVFDTLFLVHGIQVIPGGQVDADHLFAHAWVEDGAYCWDFGIIEGGDAHGRKCAYAVEPVEYYQTRQVQEATRYTVRQAFVQNRRSGTYGPWKPEYSALCGQARIG